MRFGSELKVYLPNLAHNLKEIKKLSPKCETLFMVKANAYGHGMLEISEFAYHENDIRNFGCASLAEALLFRKNLNELKTDLYVFSDLSFFDSKYFSFYKENKIIPVISDLKQLEIFLQTSEFKFVPLVLKFNTGMYRLGIDHTDVLKTIELIKKSGRQSIFHLMTHLSSSGLPLQQNKRTHEQHARFQELKNILKNSGLEVERTSISNSGAIEQGLGIDESHVRPGIMAYGPSSLLNFNESKWNGKNVSTLTTKVIKVFLAERGTPIGYGGTIIPERSLVVIVALGYGDGIGRYYSGLTKMVHGHQGKIFGRVNMDMVSFLFPPEAEKDIKLHDDFIFWNEDSNEVNRMAQMIGTISYELFCNLSVRVPRIYSLE
jgi:alanine racemase